MKNYRHSKYSYIHITEKPWDEVGLIDIDVCPQPTQSPVKYYSACVVKPSVVTNGGYFNMSNGKSVFTLVDEGTVVTNASVPRGLAITGDCGLSIANWSAGAGFRDFISGYPVLIENGKPITTTLAKEVNYNARRTVYAWNDENLYIVTVDLPGMKFGPLQTVLLGMGVTNAVNLDGGGSTIKIVKGNKVTSQIHVRPVDNVICVYDKAQAEVHDSRRVQVAAKLGVNVRSGPGTGYPRIGGAAYNTVCTIVQTTNGWGQLDTGGWLCLTYTKRL